jgi:hypothetical protein
MGYARHIGRLGALALALGVGYGVTGAPAFADTTDGTSDSSTSASRQAGQDRVSSGPSRTRGPRAAATQPRSAATAPDSDSALRSGTIKASAKDNSTPPAGPDVNVPKPSAAVAERSVPASSATVAPASSASSAPAMTVSAPVIVTTPVRVTPVRRAAAAAPRPADTTAQLISTALAPLVGGGTGGAPTQSPLMWTAAAFTRRELGRTAVRSSATALTTTGQAFATAVQSPNLLVNPGAELSDPSLSGFSAVSIPGWAITGTPTVIKYGTPRSVWPIGLSFPMPNWPSFLGFPKANSGPPDGGNQFFGGGDVATATLTQTVDLSDAATEIDEGGTSYNLSGWLGGYLFDPSGSSVKVNFLDENKTYLGTAKLNRVGALERWLQTGFKQRSTSGTLPVGTRYAQVVLNLEDRRPFSIGFPFLAGGVDIDYNNAYADNISFTIGADLSAPVNPTEGPVSTVGELDHVFMVYMENKGYNDIVNSTKAPFLNSLISAYGHANNYYGLTHPSLPNYYPVIGGTDFGLTYNCATPCIDADTTLVSNIIDAGKTWKGYAQSLQPGANPLVAAGDYSPDQLPFPAFKSIANDPDQLARIVPLEQMAIDLQSVETAPNYAWFAANEDFNGEGPVDFPWGVINFALSQLTPGNPYNIPALDQFLSETVPVVLNSAVWKDPTRKSALIVTFDEDNNNTSLGFGNEGNRVVFVVIPSKGAIDAGMRSGAFTATNHYNHYSLLRFIEDSLGLPYLTNNDKFAAPLNEFWDGNHQAGAGSLV